MKAMGNGRGRSACRTRHCPAALADGSGGSGGARRCPERDDRPGSVRRGAEPPERGQRQRACLDRRRQRHRRLEHATQTATLERDTTDVSNEAETEQKQKLDQDFGCGCDRKKDGKDGRDSGSAGSGGAGFQAGAQKADTNQAAIVG
jgi:hypothetical protein